MTHSRFGQSVPIVLRSFPMAAVAIAAVLTASPPAQAADGLLADVAMVLHQDASGPIASRRPASICDRIATCPPARQQVRQSFKLARNLPTLGEADPASELEACEDLAKMLQPKTSEHCQHVAERSDATPRQRARAFARLAYISQRAGTFDNFLVIMAKAESADPSYIEPKLARANFLILGNKAGDALDILKAVLNIDPKNAEAYVGIGRVQMILGQLRQAYVEISKGIDLGVDGPDAYYYRGSALEQQGRFLDAADDYAKALARYDPMRIHLQLMTTGDPIVHLARALVRADRPTLVAGVLAGVEKRRLLNFEKSDLLVQRAEANEKIGRFADAAADMAAATRLAAPEKRAGLYLRGSVMLQHAGRGDEASKQMAQVLDGADLRTVLRIQVFLRNHGYLDVEISGKMDHATREAVNSCFAKTECGAGIARFI